jgi:hypothetical protein
MEPISGGYVHVTIQGRNNRIYVETAGQGQPCCACTRQATTRANTAA